MESSTAVTYHAKGIAFSEKGAEKVREFLASQDGDTSAAGLRVGVRGGGCSGFQYQLAFGEQRDGDAVFEASGLRILVDAQSLPYVDGSEIDYVDSLQGAGFQVNNPNVVAACGCGSSFRDDDGQRAATTPAPASQTAPASSAAPADPAAAKPPVLATGLSEANPYFLWS